jgi:ubiquinone/menaquinone biosynthesis C-methylase UbiE
MYICPLHRLPLAQGPDSARCPDCSEPFRIENGIYLLDSVQRADRLDFDVQADVAPEPIVHTSFAERYLQEAAIPDLRQATILEIGCGLGGLTAALAQSPRIVDSDIYAFDHSLRSLYQAKKLIRPEHENRVHLSTQDASRLALPENSFTLILGSAVLHHLSDYCRFLAECYRLLRPKGVAVFAEPFVEGYFWPSFLLRLAIEELNLQDLDGPEFGMCRTILENTSYRVQNEGNLSVLDSLTDKHYFQEGALSSAAREIGFRSIRFSNLNPPEFYDNWMRHFMDVYGIQHDALRRTTLRFYDCLRGYAGTALPRIASHFKIFVMTR